MNPHGQGLSTSHQQDTGVVPVAWKEKKKELFFYLKVIDPGEECPTESELPDHSEDSSRQLITYQYTCANLEI